MSHDHLLGRWRLTLELFGRVFCDDVGAEPGSVISELGGFPVKESKFRREMEKLRNTQQRDLTLDVSIDVPSTLDYRVTVPFMAYFHCRTRTLIPVLYKYYAKGIEV